MDIRVFLVDDSEKTRRLFQDLLTGQGFTFAGTAGTEAEANFWLDEHPDGWDLAIVDLLLEQGAGLGVIERCRRIPGQGRVAVFSAYATPGVRARCLELGADVVFDKTDLSGLLEYCKGMVRSVEAGAPPTP